jgi:hypothetical protein
VCSFFSLYVGRRHMCSAVWNVLSSCEEKQNFVLKEDIQD